MADCNETLRELEAFLDSELSEETHVAIRTHLEQCPDCHQTFDFHAELKIVVAQKCRSDEMPPGLLDKLQACFGDPEEAWTDEFAGTEELDAGPDGA